MDNNMTAAANAAIRNVTLDIDTDAVLEQLAIMKSVLGEQEKALLQDFGDTLSTAWQSGNATLVAGKIEEINTSFTTMAGIIDKLVEKVNSYVTNVQKAEEVSFNNGEESSTPAQVE